jgi:hypothetical protein
MSGRKLMSCCLMVLLLCSLGPAMVAADTDVPEGNTPVVSDGVIQFADHSLLRGVPAGAQIKATPVSLVARQGIVIAGPVIKLEARELSAEALASGLLLKMPCSGDQVVLAYYNEARTPWPAWEIVPESKLVKQNGSLYVVGRITRMGVYAPLVLNARLLADSITAEQVPMQLGDRFVFPLMPGDYNIKIMNTSKPELVATNGTVGVPPYYFDTGAVVNFRIYKGDDYADTASMMVKVLAPTSAQQAKWAYAALKSMGTVLGQVQYASSANELQQALKTWQNNQGTNVRRLFGPDVKPEQFFTLFNRINAERESIMTANRGQLLQAYGSSEAEVQVLMAIYNAQAWQKVCAEEEYQWFDKALAGIGWNVQTLLAMQRGVAGVIDNDGQAALNEMRAQLRRHTELISGSLQVNSKQKTAYALSFFGDNGLLGTNDYVDWHSSALQVLSFSDDKGQPAVNGRLNPLWQQGNGQALVHAGMKDSPDPMAYIMKFAVGSNMHPGIYVESLPDGLQKIPYRVKLLGFGGYGNYEWKISKGRLPDGLELADGIISGTTLEYGSFAFTVTVRDSAYKTERSYQLEVLKNDGEQTALIYQRSKMLYHMEITEIEHLNKIYSHVAAVNDKQWQEILGSYYTSGLLLKYK